MVVHVADRKGPPSTWGGVAFSVVGNPQSTHERHPERCGRVNVGKPEPKDISGKFKHVFPLLFEKSFLPALFLLKQLPCHKNFAARKKFFQRIQGDMK
jgi:hypothetical protein